MTELEDKTWRLIVLAGLCALLMLVRCGEMVVKGAQGVGLDSRFRTPSHFVGPENAGRALEHGIAGVVTALVIIGFLIWFVRRDE